MIETMKADITHDEAYHLAAHHLVLAERAIPRGDEGALVEWLRSDVNGKYDEVKKAKKNMERAIVFLQAILMEPPENREE